MATRIHNDQSGVIDLIAKPQRSAYAKTTVYNVSMYCMRHPAYRCDANRNYLKKENMRTDAIIQSE